jgi:hypothetical protein
MRYDNKNKLYYLSLGHISFKWVENQIVELLTSDADTSEVLVPDIKHVLDEFAPLFEKTDILPASSWTGWSQGTTVHGAQPVKARPYGYSPQ